MTIDEAIRVLESHNQWRKVAELPMEAPVRIGMAIDLVVCELKTLRQNKVSGCCGLITKNMIWVSIQKRKPKQSGYYYWKGKSNYGGRAYYDADINYFDFDDSIPVNKVDESNLFWLDEENAQYEDVE